MGLRLAIDESERLFLQVILIQDMIWMVWRRWTYMSKMRNNAKATCAFKLELSDLVAQQKAIDYVAGWWGHLKLVFLGVYPNF